MDPADTFLPLESLPGEGEVFLNPMWVGREIYCHPLTGVNTALRFGTPPPTHPCFK